MEPMDPALEVLADHLSRLEPEEVMKVLERAAKKAQERDWETAYQWARGVQSAETDPYHHGD